MEETAAPAGTITTTSLSARMPWLLVAVAFASMVVFGFIENIKGTVIPSIQDTYKVSYSSIGVMLFISSSGYLLATFLGGMAGDRFGQKWVIGAGYGFILLAGLGMLTASVFPLAVFMMFLTGLGFGCLEVGVNSLGARIFVRNSALMMNLTHFFYGAGSMAGPEYAARMLVAGRPWNQVYAFASIIILVVFTLLLFARFPTAAERHAETRLELRQIVRNGKIWLFVGVLSLLVVVEIGTGNWLISYLRGVYNMDADQGARYLSFFFLTFTLGRLFGGYIVERVGYVKTIFVFGMAILLLDMAGFAVGQSGVILFSLTGFFISIMYPTFMAMVMKEFRVGTGSVMGFVITAVAAVNMLMNWVVGQTSDLLGVAAGFGSFMLYLIIAMALLLVLNNRLTFNKKDRLEAAMP
ncbi:MAG: MFS transporter [Chloroflexi bacterium]|nr:MFS transporter [Chloroflexota bacterium]MCL5275739.1 MFS transporter [Chloroflexota bacterium]